MTNHTNNYRKLWVTIAIIIVGGIIGSGFHRNLSADSDDTYQGLKLFTDVLELIEENYVDEVNSQDLVQKAVQGMVQSLDPHSQLLPPEAFEELQVDTKGEFGGIGIVITMKKTQLTVISPIEGTPAYKAGIKAGDIIIKVDGELTKDMMLWEAVKKMRGKKGTSVKITVYRKGESKPIDFDLVRATIPIRSVKYVEIKPRYGYIWLTNFQENTINELETALSELESGDKPLKGLILDLRNNPGGLLDQCVKIADLFLEDGEIVSIKGRLEKNTRRFKAHPNEIKRDYPMIVLINGGSASASEIVAGALQDHKRGLIIGTTSFGKGSVQTVASLRDGYGLKFTIARYYTPNGRSIQAQGIEPDIFVPSGFIEEPEEQKDIYLKESDLKNHLEPEQLNPDEEQDDAQEKEIHEINPHGTLKTEILLKDRQLKRALDILIGYDIFHGLAAEKID